MTDFEAKVFATTYAAAFVRFALPCSAEPTAAMDDDAAVLAADQARRAVDAWRRLAKEVMP